MKAITLTLFLLFSIGGFSQAKIEWLSWNEAVKLHKENPKKIFIDVYTDWCGWCKKMDASTFVDPAVANAMNEFFYAVKLDAEMKDSIQFNNHLFINPNPDTKRSVHTLARSLLDNQMSYPSFVLLDENFNRQYIIKGYQKVPSMLGTLLFFGSNQYTKYGQYLMYEQQKQQQAASSQQPTTGVAK